LTTDDEQLAYRVLRGILKPTLTLLTRRDWRGQQNIPSSGGCVLVTNHISHFDPLTFAHFVNDAGRAPRFMGKSEVFDLPILGRIVAGAGQIPVYRETGHAANALRAAIEAVTSGECVVVYPEATLTRDLGLWPMVGKTGAARIAAMTGCPVIPIAQWGPQDVLAAYERIPKFLPRKLIHVWAGEPVDLSGFTGPVLTADVLRSSTAAIMSAIVEVLEDIRGETAPAQLFDPKAHEDVPRIGNPDKAPRGVPKGC
jgi:1-acyl-sn-glycerol-3-phosphate acyltransferase